MTPKEKAEEIVMKMYYAQDESLRWTDDAKRCAFVSVNEMISELQSYSDLESTIVQHGCLVNVIDRLSFWQRVREELNNL